MNLHSVPVLRRLLLDRKIDFKEIIFRVVFVCYAKQSRVCSQPLFLTHI